MVRALRHGAAMLIALVTSFIAVPTLACTVTAAPRICADAGPACTGPLADQRRREADMAAGRAYGNAIGAAIDARAASPVLDRAFDLTRMLLPNVVAAIEFYDGGGCGPETVDGDLGDVISESDFIASVRTAAHLPVGAPVAPQPLMALAALQPACNDEVRRALAAYLTTAVPAEQLRETWAFIIPRAGMTVPADAAQPITDGRLTRFAGTTLAYAETRQPPYISRRRERGWAYLRNHHNGQAVMTAIGLFIDSLPADRTPATLCPVAAAERARLITQLVM
jgi:hypothetical protein